MSVNPRLVLSMINTPDKFFEEPSHVASYPGLRRSDRISILRSWKQDVILTMKASEENMAADGNPDLERINKALRYEAPEEV